MHLDHKKLTELLVEATGLAESTVEKNISELVDEIKQAIADGDAYELVGFGIFSGIGENINFIPSEELSTEINYKYVGMEPIEMDSPSRSASEDSSESDDEPAFEDDTLAEIMGGSADVEEEDKTEPKQEETAEAEFETESSEEFDDPFSGIFDSEEESESMADAEADEDDADDEITDDEAEEIQADVEEDLPEKSLDEEEESILDEIISAEEKEEGEPEEEKPGPEKWGIDTYRDDEDENRFSGLLGDEVYDDEMAGEETEDNEPAEDKLSILLDEDASSEEEPEPETSGAEEDFDDPFAGFGTEQEEFSEASAEAEEPQDEKIVPVLNVSSASGGKDSTAATGIRTRTRSRREKQNSPILLWILLGIIFLGGATYALGYFGVLDIPGIKGKDYNMQTAATSPASQNTEETAEPEVSEPQPQQEEAIADVPNEEETETEPTAENAENEVAQEQQNEPAVTENAQSAAPAGQPAYGMMGTPVAAANDGYTIVIYSLSNQQGAENVKQQLLNEGYRALVFPLPHAQYGTLYRVSLGQFETLRDAAIASEDLAQPYSESYFITKIQPN